MATARGSSNSYNVGSPPPRVVWTIVRGDTAGFKVFATDDARNPLDIPYYNIQMKIKRPFSAKNLGVITDAATLVMSLNPVQDPDDLAGEFTVSLEASESLILQTGDIFDIQLSAPQDQIVWTVAQGSLVVLEDVTD